jgi:hypothetical protein
MAEALRILFSDSLLQMCPLINCSMPRFFSKTASSDLREMSQISDYRLSQRESNFSDNRLYLQHATHQQHNKCLWGHCAALAEAVVSEAVVSASGASAAADPLLLTVLLSGMAPTAPSGWAHSPPTPQST